MPLALTMTGAPPEHWQLTGTAIFFAAVVAFAVIGFSALAIARRLDRKETDRGA